MSVIGPAAVRPHAVYDPRLRDLVHHSGDVATARIHGVPPSTANDWKLGKFRSQVVGLDVLDRDKADLQAEVLRLRRRLRVCGAMIGLLVALVRLLGLKLTELGRAAGWTGKGPPAQVHRAGQEISAAQGRPPRCLVFHRRGITAGAGPR